MVPIFSAAAIGLGVTTALLGSWAERVGRERWLELPASCGPAA